MCEGEALSVADALFFSWESLPEFVVCGTLFVQESGSLGDRVQVVDCAMLAEKCACSVVLMAPCSSMAEA